MKTLSFHEIKTILFGCPNCKEQDDGLHLFKMTDSQMEAWKREDDFVYSCSCTATGVTLDFHTDAEKIVLSLNEYTDVDFLVDGLLVKDARKNEENPISLKLDGKKHRVTIYFSSHDAKTVIQKMEVSDGAQIIPHEFSRKILFIGDSITQGWQSDYDCLSYANIVSRYYNAESNIQGVGGSYFCADTIEDTGFAPDFIIVALGTNDSYRDKTSKISLDHAKEAVEKLRNIYPRTKIFGITPIYRTDMPKDQEERLDDIRKGLTKLFEENRFVLVDGLTLVPHLREFYSDGNLHPNALGFSIFAQNLIQVINQNI